MLCEDRWLHKHHTLPAHIPWMPQVCGDIIHAAQTLSFFRLCNSQVAGLAKSLHQCSALQSLILWDNELGTTGTASLMQVAWA